MPEGLPEKIASESKSYKVLKKLGEGGTSIVYLVEDEKRKLALKILGEGVDPVFLERYIEILKNEFEILSRLRHPNIARVFDFEYSPELQKYFFTTEYVEGTDILTFTERSDFRTKEELFVQFLNALENVHQNGLIHCDIKCGNILVTMVKDAPVIKLVDFGFATSHLVTTKYVVGTLHYLAPELVLKMADIDARVDIYAAGVVLYKLLFRKYPCPTDQIPEVVEWHQTRCEFSYPEDTPDYIKQLINRMTAIYPSDRFSSPAKAIEFINNRTEGRYNKIVSKIVSLIPQEGVLVGREDILSQIRSIVDEIKTQKISSRLGLVFAGQQGMGKSRIIKEVKYRAELAEIPVKEITCDTTKDLVSEFMAQFGDVGVADLGCLDTSKPDSMRGLKIVQWINGVISKYDKKGLIVFIDDIQFSNQPFIELLTEFEKRLYINREEGNKIPILLVIGSRPKETLIPLVKKWWDQTKLEIIELKNLTEKDIEIYSASIGVKSFEKHRKAMLEFSSGIPQLVEAYCQHLMSPKGMAKPPANLAQSYLERMKFLSDKSAFCLEVMSVAHRNFKIDEIVDILNNNKETIADILQELIQFNFIKKDFSSMEIAVENRALAQVVKGNLNEKELKEISNRLGNWFETREPESYVELAQYFVLTDDVKKAKNYTLEAAKKLEQIYNCSEAMKYYELAKGYAKDEDELTILTRAQAKLNIIMGQFNEAVKSLEDLDKSAKAILSDYINLGTAYAKLHDFNKARGWYEKGLSCITDETAVTDIVQFKNNLGNIHFYMGDLEKSEKYFTEAIADATVCLLLDNNLGLILGAKGKYNDAIDFYSARKKYLEAKANKRALSLCYAESGYVHMTSNHFKEAIADFEKSYELSTQIDDWHNILIVLGNLIRIYQQMSQYSKALEYAQKSLKLEGKMGSLEDIAQTHLTVGILYESLGVFDLARQHINMARDRFVAMNNKLMLGWCCLTNAYLEKDMGNFEKALNELDGLDKILKDVNNDDLKAWSKLTRADLYLGAEKYKDTLKALKEIEKEPGLEFSMRKKLIETNVESIEGKKILYDKFEDMAKECEKNQFIELEWEIYAALGKLYEMKEKSKESLLSYQRANEIIENIANGLSEAYRDSYKQQNLRRKIVEKINPKLATVKRSEKSLGGESEESIHEDKTRDLSKILK